MLLSLAFWEDPMKSLLFCCFSTFIIIWFSFCTYLLKLLHTFFPSIMKFQGTIHRGWIAYATVGILLFMALFILLTKLSNRGRSIEELKVVALPSHIAYGLCLLRAFGENESSRIKSEV
ncbi:uncharacterized protein LOC144561469 isoform X1 [Carex rostrata]